MMAIIVAFFMILNYADTVSAFHLLLENYFSGFGMDRGEIITAIVLNYIILGACMLLIIIAALYRTAKRCKILFSTVILPRKSKNAII